MLTGYKKISLIYGGSGKYYATEIERSLKALHYEERLPIHVECLNSNWVGNNILSTVVRTINNSDLVFIIFTLDDIGCANSEYESIGEKALCGRLRQNVLIELGMALSVVGDDIDRREQIKIIADFDKTELGEDFPSDIRNEFSIQEFQKADFDKMLIKMTNYVRDSIGVSPTTHILHNKNAVLDFENVFEEFDQLNQFRTKKIKKLRDILDLWLPTIESFDFAEERLLYAFERVKSLPVFGERQELISWIKKYKKATLAVSTTDKSERQFIMFVQDVFDCCVDYTIIKATKELDLSGYQAISYQFRSLYDKYQQLLKQSVEINPVISFCLLEYYGLTLMRIYNLTKDRTLLDKLIDLFNESVEIANNCDTHFRLYNGYISFNLGRAYYHRYIEYGKDEDKILFNELMTETISIRKRWKDYDTFLPCYINALSYEYFYAESEYIKMKKRLGILSDKMLADNINTLIEQIDEYICKDSELDKLYKIKNNCKNLLSK